MQLLPKPLAGMLGECAAGVGRQQIMDCMLAMSLLHSSAGSHALPDLPAPHRPTSLVRAANV